MKNKFILLLGLLIIALKLLIIDVDPPKWEMSYYSAIDELFYVTTAYNLFETGDLWGETTPSAMLSIFTNFFSYLSFEIFGDNYLGLRFSSVFFSLVSFVFFFLLLNRCTKNFRFKLVAVLFFTLNFGFTTANLVVEPTIARMMAALLSLWLVVQWKERKLEKPVSLIWQSAVIGSLFLFSYPTNAFIVLAAYLALVLLKKSGDGQVSFRIKFKEILLRTGYFAIGIAISLLVFYLVNLTLGADLLQIGSRTGASSYSDRVAFNPVQVLINLKNILLTNIFRFNPLFLILVSISVLGFVSGKLKKLNNTVLITLIFLACFVAQTAFINDFFRRKLIIILPFVILVGVYGLELLWEQFFFRKKKKFLLVLLGLGCLPLLPLFYWERVFFAEHHILLIYTILGVSVIIVLILTGGKKKILLNVLFFLLILPELTFLTRHYVLERSYHYKNMYKELSTYDGHQFIGGFSKGFGLYNNIQPILNNYDFRNNRDEYWQKKEILSRNGIKDYSIGVSEQEQQYLQIGFKPVKVLLCSEKTLGEESSWILYEEITVD